MSNNFSFRAVLNFAADVFETASKAVLIGTLASVALKSVRDVKVAQ